MPVFGPPGPPQFYSTNCVWLAGTAFHHYYAPMFERGSAAVTESHIFGPRPASGSTTTAEPGEPNSKSATVSGEESVAESYPLLVTVTVEPARGEVLVARMTVSRNAGEPAIRGAYTDGLLTVSRDAAAILRLTGTPVINLDPLVEHLRLEQSDANGLGPR
jgi:hypothetical protein